MVSNCFLLNLVLLSVQAPAEPRPQLTLRASTTQPYVGQVVELQLQIDLPPTLPSEPVKLQIPWLTREFGFVWQIPTEKWMQQLSPASQGVPAQINDWPQVVRLPSRQIGNAQRCELTRTLIVQEPDPMTHGRIVFAAVQLQTTRGGGASKPLPLEVRKVPLPPPDLPGANLNLGVGDYHLEASIAPDTMAFGKAASLTLKVSGAGALGLLPRPKLTALPFFRDAKTLAVENGTDTLDADAKARAFCYQLHPRQPGTLTIPSIYYTCFDPAQEKYQTRSTAALLLTVRASASPSAKAAIRYPPGSVPERLRLAPPDAALLDSPSWFSVFGCYGPLVIAMLLILIIHDINVWWREGRRGTSHHGSLAGRRALAQLRQLKNDVEDAAVASVVVGFLSQRFQIGMAEPTLHEVAVVLRTADISEQAFETARSFYALLDARRFGPQDTTSASELRTRAERLIQELDA